MTIKLPNYPDLWESGVDGPAPAIWFGKGLPNGDSQPFSTAPKGSLYIQSATTPTVWMKTEDAAHDSDWTVGEGVITQRVTRAQFTDGGGAVGTLTMDGSIPVGAFVERVIVTDVTGFAGNVSAVLDVGDGTDDDRYNAAAGFNVFADAVALDGGIPQGTQVHTAAKTPVLTLTASTDFTAVTAGAMTVKIFYLR
jgi:hypothetical protein